MIEPGVRYHPHPAIQANIPSHITLEAAVDLTKKTEDWRPPSAEQDADDGDDHEDSDSDTPLDMSVSASRLTPVFPGFRRDHSPARSDRSEPGSRSGPGYFSPVPGARDWSTERSEADKGKPIFIEQDNYGNNRKYFSIQLKVRFSKDLQSSTKEGSDNQTYKRKDFRKASL